MEAYQYDFIKLCLRSDVIQLGEFILKSGRKSPYFFNSGFFNTGKQLAQIGECYAEVLMRANLAFDVLFGPAYKGIPLACACAIGLSRRFNLDKPYCFNRKEIKDHGEGGGVIGAPLRGRVCIIEDVITKGTAIRASAELIKASGATISGIIVLLDRQERGVGNLSAVQEIEMQLSVPVFSVIKLDNLIEYIAKEKLADEHLSAIKQYRAQYGVDKS